MRHRSGNSIMEVLLAISIASIIVASVGNLIVSVNRVDRTSAHRDQAVAYAREALEITAAKASTTSWFVCTVESGVCTAPDGQTCTPLSGYKSCWTKCPRGFFNMASGDCTATEFHLNRSTGLLETGLGLVTAGSIFTESIKFTDLDGSNVKNVTTMAMWKERSADKKVILSTILTGWKNIP